MGAWEPATDAHALKFAIPEPTYLSKLQLSRDGMQAATAACRVAPSGTLVVSVQCCCTHPDTASHVSCYVPCMPPFPWVRCISALPCHSHPFPLPALRYADALQDVVLCGGDCERCPVSGSSAGAQVRWVGRRTSGGRQWQEHGARSAWGEKEAHAAQVSGVDFEAKQGQRPGMWVKQQGAELWGAAGTKRVGNS